MGTRALAACRRFSRAATVGLLVGALVPGALLGAKKPRWFDDPSALVTVIPKPSEDAIVQLPQGRSLSIKLSDAVDPTMVRIFLGGKPYLNFESEISTGKWHELKLPAGEGNVPISIEARRKSTRADVNPAPQLYRLLISRRVETDAPRIASSFRTFRSAEESAAYESCLKTPISQQRSPQKCKELLRSTE